MKSSLILCLALSVMACAKPSVRCDTRLEAINVPRPAAAEAPRTPVVPAPALPGSQP